MIRDRNLITTVAILQVKRRWEWIGYMHKCDPRIIGQRECS